MKPRIVFFGTPEFAVSSLERLIEFGDVIAVFTKPDRPKGRSKKLIPSPVKEHAITHAIPVFQPSTLKKGTNDGDQAYTSLKELEPDVAVVVAYGHIIPQRILDIPQYGFVNVHGSLLPRFRGASPIQAALLAGDEETGVTIMQMDAGMDTGAMLMQESIHIEPQDNASTLHDKLQDIGSSILCKALPGYLDGSLVPQPQDDSKATACGLISKKDGLIDWNEQPAVIERQIRAYTPWPGAYTHCGPSTKELRVVIRAAHLDAHGQLVIDRVQPAGKKEMSYDAFIRGYPNCTIPSVTY